MSEAAPVAYRYTGDGTAYLNDVPARDLTDADVALLDAEQRAAVAASGLYAPAGATAPAAPAEKE